MKLAFSTLGCTELSLPEIASLARTEGYSGVELRGAQGEHVDPSLSRKERREIRKLFSDNNVDIFSVSAYTRFASCEGRELEDAVSELVRYGELAADLGARFVRTFLGEWDAADTGKVFDRTTAALHTAAEELSPHSVQILIETHDSVSAVKELLPLFDGKGMEKIGILWDTAHSYRAGEEPAVSLKRIGSRLGYVHLKDEYNDPVKGKVICLPGEGSLPLPEILRVLKDSEYDPWICLEWERKWHPEIAPIHQALPIFRTIVETVCK